jgi:3-hydroxy-4-methylanthranilate adenylyltransferase
MTAVEPVLDVGWVDGVLLAGPDDEVCLHLGVPVTRAALRQLVAQRQERLAAHGLTGGGSVALRMPSSLAYIANLLAAWRIGAQVALLDHRLTQYEVDRAFETIAPQVVVSAPGMAGPVLRVFHEVTETVATHPGRPAATPHALLQLSSGSTGPSKVIGRTAANLVAEVDRYTKIDGVPRPGERVVVLASMVHVLGLVGGLLYGLHAHVRVVAPERLAVDQVLQAARSDATPVTVLGVPFHIELLASVAQAPELPQFVRMTTGGELVRAEVVQRFTDRYPAILGNMYGMTEVGVIATDLYGRHRPALMPAPGIPVREGNGEILVGMAASPYVGLTDPARFVDGWLHTKDGGSVDPRTGLVTIRGRLDSQVSIGGLKVDLTEVEHTLAALPGVGGAVVVHDGGIEAYLMLSDPTAADGLADALATRLAPYKRPRQLHILDQLPRNATGKLIRNTAALRDAAAKQEKESGT